MLTFIMPTGDFGQGGLKMSLSGFPQSLGHALIGWQRTAQSKSTNCSNLDLPVKRATVWGMIDIRYSSGEEWLVSIRGSVTTHHRVRVTKADLARFAEGHSAEDLLKESFRFLLEREPNTSILTSFDLPLIGSYFPEYERQIRGRLR